MSPEALADCARRAARSLRLGMEAAAGEALMELVDGIGVRLERDPGLAQTSGPTLAELFGAQARRDPIGAADVLEYQLVELLERS